MRRIKLAQILGVAALAAALAVTPLTRAEAYTPTATNMYQLPADQPCLKGRGNCIIYAKSAELPSGRLVAAFEKATVTKYPAPDTVGGAVGGTMPVWKSDDSGDTWQKLADVASPAAMSSDPAVAKYSSNWGSPYLFVMPQTVGNIPKGTLLLASLVTGEDEYYREQKQADPNWIPTNDGDRRDVSIALYRSNDQGASWSFLNIIADGGWQGGSAGAMGTNVAKANTNKEQDPVWEPHLIVYKNQLVAYYSDEHDYSGYNTTTGVPTRASYDETGPESRAQILVHKTWDGTSNGWSQPVVDVSGDTFNFNGAQQIGGGRPGMTTVAQTTDGRWMMTFEYFGGGDNVRYKIADDPTRFFADGDPNGEEISRLPVTSGSKPLTTGGSPVVTTLPDGRIAFNAAGSGDVWINNGSSTGAWTDYQTTMPSGYTRTLQPVGKTGRVVILQGAWNGPNTEPVIKYGDIDFGYSAGSYYRIVNKKTGQVIGTGNNTTDANIGNSNQPDVVLEASGAARNQATQLWHVTDKPNGTITLLNKSGGRAAGIWTAQATAGQKIGQWVDDTPNGLWTLVRNSDGTVRFRSTANAGLSLSGTTAGGALTLQPNSDDGSQTWQLVPEETGSVQLQNVNSNKCADVWDRKVSDLSAVNQFACGTGLNQRWNLRTAGSAQEIVSVSSGKCLDIPMRSTAAGTRADQYTCDGGSNQLWVRSDAGNGTVTYRNQNSGLCLEVFGASAADGAQLGQWTCNGGANQRWTTTG